MIIIMFTIFTIMIIVLNLFSRDDWCICDEGEVNPNKNLLIIIITDIVIVMRSFSILYFHI